MVESVSRGDGFARAALRPPRTAAACEQLHARTAVLAGAKNCWTISEQRGRQTPYAFQHLLSRASWDADAVRDDLRGYVVDAFGEHDGIYVLDETGDVKSGVASATVQRQYTGTAGRIENSQVTVCMT